MRRRLAALTKRSWSEDFYVADAFEVASVEGQYLIDLVYVHHGDEARIMCALSGDLIFTCQPLHFGKMSGLSGKISNNFLNPCDLSGGLTSAQFQAIVFERSGSHDPELNYVLSCEDDSFAALTLQTDGARCDREARVGGLESAEEDVRIDQSSHFTNRDCRRSIRGSWLRRKVLQFAPRGCQSRRGT